RCVETARWEALRASAERPCFQIPPIRFEQPGEFRPFVAHLYQWWNHRRHITDERLLVASFIVMEPYWAVRTGSIPFWMVFNKEPSAQALEAYLACHHAFKEIYLMLFSHGVNSIGLVPIERWRRALDSAQQHGSFVGVDPEAYPRDFGVFVRYNPDLKRKIPARYSIPPAPNLDELDGFLSQSTG